MIRFACPGCGATFTVDDSKGGKAGKCPKCQSQFSIPMPDAAAAPPPAPTAPPPPPPSAAGTPPGSVEIAPCPGCQARLTVSATDLGADVECPYCKQVYTATAAGGTGGQLAVPKPPAPPPADEGSLAFDDDRGDADDDRPSRRGRKTDDDDDRGDEDDDRPKKKKKKKKSRAGDMESKKTMAGILALLLGGFGVHKFYLGYTTAGIIQIVLTCCTGTGGIIALVEGIMYLTKSDEEFIETYQVGEKQWF